MIGERAAALGAAEAQVLQRHITAACTDDRLQIGWRLMVQALHQTSTHSQREVGAKDIEAQIDCELLTNNAPPGL